VPFVLVYSRILECSHLWLKLQLFKFPLFFCCCDGLFSPFRRQYQVHVSGDDACHLQHSICCFTKPLVKRRPAPIPCFCCGLPLVVSRFCTWTVKLSSRFHNIQFWAWKVKWRVSAARGRFCDGLVFWSLDQPGTKARLGITDVEDKIIVDYLISSLTEVWRDTLADYIYHVWLAYCQTIAWCLLQ